jgi:hypothetical protein
MTSIHWSARSLNVPGFELGAPSSSSATIWASALSAARSPPRTVRDRRTSLPVRGVPTRVHGQLADSVA